MSSFNELLREERDLLSARSSDQPDYSQDDDPGLLGLVGAPLGLSRWPNFISNPYNNLWERYPLSYTSAGLRWLGGSTVNPLRVSRWQKKYGFVPKSSAVTSRDDFKTTEMSNNNKKNRNQTRKGRRRMPLQGGDSGVASPGTKRKNASGYMMVMGRDGIWHDYEVSTFDRALGHNVNAFYNVKQGRYVYANQVQNGSGQWVSYNPKPRHGRGRPNAPVRRPRRVRHPIGQPPDMQTGLTISGASTSGDQSRVIKNPRSPGDDVTTMDMKIYLGNIGLATTGKTTWTPSVSGSDIGGQYYFNPNLPAYIGTATGAAMTATAARYRRYRIVKGEMSFSPLVSGYSNPDIRVAALLSPDVDEFAAVSNTPSNFVGSPATPTAVDTPVRAVIMSNPKACATPAWTEKGFSCPIPRTRWLYCQSPDSNQSLNNPVDYTNSWAAYRQTLGFVLGLNISGTAGASTINVLEGWIDVKVQFKGQGVVASTVLSLSRPLETKVDRILRILQDTGMLPETKTGEDERAYNRLIDDYNESKSKRSSSPAPSEKWVTLRDHGDMHKIIQDSPVSTFRPPINEVRSSSNKSK